MVGEGGTVWRGVLSRRMVGEEGGGLVENVGDGDASCLPCSTKGKK